MMRKYLPVLIAALSILLFSISSCLSQDKNEAGERFKKLMQLSHPEPEEQPTLHFMVPFMEENTIPEALFDNSCLTVNENEEYMMQNESSIAVNPKNPLNIIGSAVDYRDNSASWVYVSQDGGKSWVNLDHDRPYPGWTSSNDPSVAFDPDGTCYVVYGAFGYRGDTNGISIIENGVFMSKTTDGGLTWKNHIPVIVHKGHPTLDSVFDDKYYITVDCAPASPYYKNLYIPWKRLTPRDSATQIVVTKSTDGGETWNTPVPASYRLKNTSEDTTWGQSFPLVTTGPNGEVYVVWNHGTQHGVGFAKSTDGGATFSEPRIIQHYEPFGIALTSDALGGSHHTLKGCVRAETYPSLTCDVYTEKNKGNLYLTWAGGMVPDIFFSRSTDQGNTWSNPVVVHSDTKNDQFWQWLALDQKNGDLAVMYLDSRNDTNNINVDCYISYSSDAGTTWLDRKVSDISGDIRLNPFGGNSFAGDYSGCAFQSGKIYPSWIDMRNAKKNIYDSDIYTGLISVQAPMPVENFKANTLPEQPTQIKLTWSPPQSRVFGQSLLPSDYKYSLYRESQFIADISSSTLQYIDTNLVPYSLYRYEIFVKTDSDISAGKKDSAFAGGGRLPAAPVLISMDGNAQNEATLTVKLPTLREDGSTPLVNLAKIVIYRDSANVAEIPVAVSDTGKTLTFTDKPGEKGYYKYMVSVKDGTAQQNESKKSTEITGYTGKVDASLEEHFDETAIPRFLNVGGWNFTNKFYYSSPNSLTESPNGNYSPNKTYLLTLFPLHKQETKSWDISFWHAAIVDPTDTAIVEYSTGSGSQFIKIASFNMSTFLPWKDSLLNTDDWKYEHFTFGNNNDTVVVRFRLKSNITKVSDGWYIDDVLINPSESSVGEEPETAATMIYPNPANDYVTINGIKGCGKIILSNVFGEEVKAAAITEGQMALTLDISALGQGFYSIRSVNGSRSGVIGKFVKVR